MALERDVKAAGTEGKWESRERVAEDRIGKEGYVAESYMLKLLEERENTQKVILLKTQFSALGKERRFQGLRKVSALTSLSLKLQRCRVRLPFTE